MPLLRRRLPYYIGETATSYASRLSAYNGSVLSRFCTHMGVARSEIVNGSDEALKALEALSGVNAAVLRGGIVRKIDDVTWDLRGQTQAASTLRRLRPWFCPMCAKEDLGTGAGVACERVFERSIWSIEQLRTCQVHHVALIEIAPGDDTEASYDFASTFASTLPGLDDLCGSLVALHPSGLESYLQARLLTGRGGSDWLDRLEFHVAAQIVERVGGVTVFGRRANVAKMSAEDRWQAGFVGFDRLRSGPEGLTDVLVELKRSYEFGLSGLAGPRALYGTLWQWLENRCSAPEFHPVKEIIREHVLDSIPLASGTEVLGQVLEHRRLHSIRSASIHYRRHPKRLRSLLVAHGLIGEDTKSELDAHVTFSAENAEQFLSGISTSMRAAEVKEFLNVSHIEPYVQGGVLTPIAAILGKRDGQLEFLRSDVERLLFSLTRNAVLVTSKVEGKTGIYEASKKAMCTIATILNLIASGKLTWVGRIEGARGLECILVDPEETKVLLTTIDTEHLAEYQVIRRLGVNRVAVRKLIEHGLLGRTNPVRPEAKNQKRIVRTEDVDRFERTYVSLFNLSKERGEHARTVKKRLGEQSIFPALHPEIYSTSFYLRSSL